MIAEGPAKLRVHDKILVRAIGFRKNNTRGTYTREAY
jgi:hypothetical protein